MAGRGDIEAGAAFVRLFFKDEATAKIKTFLGDFQSSLAKAGPILTAATGAMAAGFAAVTAAAAASLNEFANVGSEINDVAARTGLAAQQLQHLKFAAEQSGASLEDVEKAAIGLAKNGLKLSDFERLGQQIAAIEDPSQRTAAALETFGKSGAKLIPMFAELNNLKAASAATGAILTDEEVARADALGDAFGAMKESVSRLSQQFAKELAPALQQALETMIGLTAQVSEIAGPMTQIVNSINKATALTLALRYNPVGAGAAYAAASQMLADAQARGQTAVAGVGASNRAKALAGDGEGGGSAGGGLSPIEAARLDFLKQVNAAYEARQRLIRGLESPHEAFLRREQEIVAAIKNAAAAGNSFVIPFDEAKKQVTELHVALARLRQQEMERLRREGIVPGKAGEKADKLLPEIAEKLKPEFAVSSAFSAAGAAALQMGSGGSAWQRLADAFKKGSTFEPKILRAIEELKHDRRGVFR